MAAPRLNLEKDIESHGAGGRNRHKDGRLSVIARGAHFIRSVSNLCPDTKPASDAQIFTLSSIASRLLIALKSRSVIRRTPRYLRRRAASLAKYVRMKSAPARLIEIRLSIIRRSRSTQPSCAAAAICENSPLT